MARIIASSTSWLWVAVILALGAGAALAHHGWTGYDEQKTIELTGSIRESSYESPHASIRLETAGPNPKTWTAILAPPSRMTARGLMKEAIKPGTMATVVGYAHKSTPDELRAERIIIGGKTTELR